MAKSPEAFRTISEVAALLDVPAHVLRFWESRFPQIKPIKRAGGRRYYRPADIQLLDGIRRLLHDDGMTIRGVQKLLREDGVRKVAAFGAATRDAEAPEDHAEVPTAAEADAAPAPTGEAAPDDGARRVVPFAPRARPPEPDQERRPPASEPHAPLQDQAAAGPSPPTAPGTGPGAGAPLAQGDLFDASGPEMPRPPASPDMPPESREENPDAAAMPPDGPAVPTAPTAAVPAPGAAVPSLPDLPPDPADDDPDFALPPLDLSRLPRDAARLRPIYERLLAARTRLGEAPRRAAPGR